MQNFRHPSALWLSAQSCGGAGNLQKIKEIYPDAQILPLDYDPDVSFANIENRLQMLVMNIKK